MCCKWREPSFPLPKWFECLLKYVEETDPTLLSDPTRIYNCDESGFALCLNSKKLLALKAVKGDRHLI